MTTPFNLSVFANSLNSSGNANPSTVSDQGNTSTGSLGLPVGTTAQRNGTPINGMTRINSTNNALEIYYNGSWVTISTLVQIPSAIEYFVVAGGGGAGTTNDNNERSGAGGAGGLLTGNTSVQAGSTYTITVGAGGSGAAAVYDFASNGSQSTINLGGTAIVSTEGGGAGRSNIQGAAPSGGSGGGGGSNNSEGRAGGAGTSGQGYSGGSGNANRPGGGGGGAGEAGKTGDFGGYGGIGVNSSFSGTSVGYAGGGAGGGAYLPGGDYSYGGGTPGSPGVNGGNGGINTGGGGGGGRNSIGGSGGSGVVIVRYADTYAPATSTTGSPTYTVSGGYRIYKWISSGSITF